MLSAMTHHQALSELVSVSRRVRTAEMDTGFRDISIHLGCKLWLKENPQHFCTLQKLQPHTNDKKRRRSEGIMVQQTVEMEATCVPLTHHFNTSRPAELLLPREKSQDVGKDNT